MRFMINRLFSHRRRQARRHPAGLDEGRIIRRPAPQPRMRWY
jgi:hypothetical protein